MAVLTRDEAKRLFEATGGTRVSLYLPTHRAGDEIQQGPIRLENQLKKARAELEELGYRKPQVEELLKPAQELVQDMFFWRHQDRGLAVFLGPDGARTYRTPISFREIVVVNERYHLKPLLPLLTGDGRFTILAVSQNRVRVFDGSRDSVRELDAADIPANLKEAVGYDFEENSLQFQTGTPSQGNRRAAMFHGHGGGKEADKDEIETFFRVVDDALLSLLPDRTAPLVLAAVDYLHPIYRDVSDHPHILPQGIVGNADRLDAREIHAKAWEIVGPVFAKERDEAVARYGDRLTAGRACPRFADIVGAAHEGRVETLFVERGRERWGTFDPTSGKVLEARERGPGDQDLLNLAAFTSLAKGATVYAMEPETVPGGGPLAAIYRY